MTSQKILFCIFLFLTSISSIAQTINISDSSKLFFSTITFQQGLIISDESVPESITDSHPIMFQAAFSFINNTQKAWNQCMCYGKTGFSLSYADFKNPEQLGEAFNLNVFTEPILYYSPRFQVSLRGSVGLSYLNVVYDPQDNPDNLFYSSPISFLLSLGTYASYKVTPYLGVELGAQFNHISNGKTRYPNWGLNFPTLAIGIDYIINRGALIPRSRSKFIPPPLKIITHTSIGQHLEADQRKIVVEINSALIKQVSRVNGVGLGIDVAYDPVYKVVGETTGESYNTFVSSLSVRNYFFYGRLLFGQQLAYYLVSPTPDRDKRMHQIFTLEVQISNQWYVGILLKTHDGISDYISASISKVIQLRRSE